MREILKFMAFIVLISLGLIYLLHQSELRQNIDPELVVPPSPSATVRLPPGQKLVQYDYAPKTGFYHEFSYLTRGMRSGETPETYNLVRMSENNAVDRNVILLVEQAIRAESDPAGPDPTRK
jgi:hypothetical protein